MDVRGLVWTGTRTGSFAETRRFFESTLELPVGNHRPHFVRFDLPDAGSVELFDAHGDSPAYFSTGPVVGFQVKGFDRARTELEEHAFALLGEIGGRPGEYRWQHFRGPAGLVFEIVDYPNRPDRKPPVGELKITKLVWMGISTPAFEEVARFYKETFDLPIVEESSDLIECRLPDGSSVEAFRRESEMDHPHFRTGPVPGLGVTDIDAAARLLQRRGVRLLRERRAERGGWAHFRAPDGNIYEIKQSSVDYRW